MEQVNTYRCVGVEVVGFAVSDIAVGPMIGL